MLQVVLINGAPVVDDQVAARPPPPPRSRRALWIGVGVGAAAAVTLAIVLGVVLAPHDYAGDARSGCHAPCMVLEFK